MNPPVQQTDSDSSRDAINPLPPSVEGLGLLEALKAITKVRVEGHDNIWAGRDRCVKIALAAIARAESSQGVDASLVEDLGAGTGSPTSRRGSHIVGREST